jgi:hypothetical protein
LVALRIHRQPDPSSKAPVITSTSPGAGLLCRSIVPELVNVVVPISWPDPNTTEHERANHPRFHCGNLQYERRLATDSNNKLINGNSAVEFIANDAPAIREYDKLARQCAAEGADYSRYLLRLAELELIERERRMVEGRIKAARFPAVKSLDSFDFAALPSLNKALVMELARSEYIERHQNIIAIGNSGTGKSHVGRLHHRRRPRARTDRGPR